MMAKRRNVAFGKSFQDRLKQKAESEQRRREQVTAMAARTANEPTNQVIERPQRDVAAFRVGIASIPLYYIDGSATPLPLSPTYTTLVEAAIGAMNTGERKVLMCWPPQSISLSTIADLIALGDVASAKQTTITPAPDRIDHVAEAPKGLRALFYPYARTTHAAAREVQVDRTALAAIHMRHRLRALHDGDDDALADYHLVLNRVQVMKGMARDGRSYAEFQHPVLDELLPYGRPSTGCREKGELLFRTKSKTDIGEFPRSRAADNPAKARFFLFEVGAEDNFTKEFCAIGDAPDIVLIDLSKAARARLGREWVSAAHRFVEALESRWASCAIVAITDDPWSFDAARFDVLGTRVSQSSKRRKPAPATGLLSSTGDILVTGRNTDTSEWAGGDRILVDGFSGQLDEPITNMREIARKLRERGNSASAEIARSIVAKLRRSVSLPGSLSELSDFLERDSGDAVAVDNLAAYRVESDLSMLADPRRGGIQIGADELNHANAEVQKVISDSETGTPMASLVEEALGGIIRSSSNSIFVFRSEMIADFAADRLEHKFEKLTAKLKSGQIHFSSRQGFADIAGLQSSRRNQFKRAIVVAPTRQSALEFLSQPWLPEEITFLADTDTLKFAARDAARLATLFARPELKARLQRFSEAANARIGELGAHMVALDTIVPPTSDVEFPFGSVIDLSGSQRGDRRLIELRTESGQRILARPRTGLVLQDNTRAVPRFKEIAAEEVTRGDSLCVIGPGFIERARSLLNITAAAAEEIRDYHELVLKRFGELPGDSVQERLRELCRKMGTPEVNPDTARYWINLEDQMDKPLHEVVPHAPHDRDTFMRFTEALDISATLAGRFWTWAVIAQRSSRLRAGTAFHDAYKGILTDEHTAFAANKGHAAEIQALRATAADYVSPVVSIKKEVRK